MLRQNELNKRGLFFKPTNRKYTESRTYETGQIMFINNKVQLFLTEDNYMCLFILINQNLD